MACESCKVVVRDTLRKFKLTPLKVELGEADVKEKMSAEVKRRFNNEIKKVGLEIVESKNGIVVEQIKKCILDYVTAIRRPTVNFSDYLSQALHYDYNYLSNLFTEVMAMTIAGYMTAVRMERAKEMMLFEELTLSQIAHKLHYSNLSHFSAQFKKATGFPPSHFKELKDKRRKAIHELTDGK
ncbi:MAG: AraC family transcriptional regulator [Bacteroidetes bacterium]|nr:AraC family transcriptional regulator [Bacteroidota bacterium]